MSKDTKFWDGLADKYNKIANSKAYRKLFALIRQRLTSDMTILEIGTSSGLIARAVADKVKTVYAVDISEAMIKKAKSLTTQSNIDYSVQSSDALAFADNSFDVVIIASVLHIVDNPEACLLEIKRVLKDDGILIAPTPLWKEKGIFGSIVQFIMEKRNFPIYSKWNTTEFLSFLDQNGFYCIKKDSVKLIINFGYFELKTKVTVQSKVAALCHLD